MDNERVELDANAMILALQRQRNTAANEAAMWAAQTDTLRARVAELEAKLAKAEAKPE